MVGFYYHAAAMAFDHAAHGAGPPVRVAVVGAGERGGAYARALVEGRVAGAVLVALCDADDGTRGAFGVPGCLRVADLPRSEVDAWVVATPPSDHAASAVAAFEAGVHLLLEKPIATTATEARRLLRVHARLAPGCVFATALPLRADPRYLMLERLLLGGEIGEVSRVAWTVTDCFRTDAYYASRPWRARSGGGGGVLYNQCLHQLDLLVRHFGMPRRVEAMVRIGRHHPIDVEDDVTALLELANGGHVLFVASTGEAPGSNRLEVAGSLARVVIEGDGVEMIRNSTSAQALARTGKAHERAPKVLVERHTLARGGLDPAALLEDFVASVRHGIPPRASAASSLSSLDLADAILRAGSEGRPVMPLPLLEPESAGFGTAADVAS